MIPGSANPLLLASATGAAPSYQIERSLRFNSADSAYLSRTPASAGNRKTWTWSGWVKLAQTTGYCIFSSTSEGGSLSLGFSGDKVVFQSTAASTTTGFTTTQVFRDYSSYYHLVLAVDTTQATADDRVKLYVNGNRVTQFDSKADPAQNAELMLNVSGLGLSSYLDGTSTGTTGTSRTEVLNIFNENTADIFGFTTGGTGLTKIWQFTSGWPVNAGDTITVNAQGHPSALWVLSLANGQTLDYNTGTTLVVSSNTVISSVEARTGGASSQFSNIRTIAVNGTQLTYLPAQPFEIGVGTNALFADVKFIDGQGLDASSFGSFDETTNVWSPVAYAGTYGNNGVYLSFENNASISSLVLDYSGQGNDYTAINFQVGSPTPNLLTYLAGTSTGTQTVTINDVKLAFDNNPNTFFGFNVGSLNKTKFWNFTSGYPLTAGDSVSVIGYAGGSPSSFFTYRVVLANGQELTRDNPAITVSSNTTISQLKTESWGASSQYAYITSITVNGERLALFADNDSLVDTPTSYGTDTGNGGEVRGNYATLNPLAPDFNAVSANSLTNGNLQAQQTLSSYGGNYATFAIPTSGKWYFEVTYQSVASASNNQAFGIRTLDNSKQFAFDSPYTGTGTVNSDGVNDTSVGLATAGDIYGLAVDSDSLSATMYRNGSTLKTYTMTSGVIYFPFFRGYNSGISQYNFGQRPFAYPAPSGYKALCTTNLPEPVVAQPSTVMDVALWTGSNIANARTISGLNFSPDFVWIKNRTVNYGNQLFDAVRGTTRGLSSNTTGAEFVNDIAGTLSSFNSDGFTTSPVTNNSSFNDPAHAYVAWTWDAGSSTVTNTQGSITSQVRANASAGFSIVKWTATGANGTIGHGLNVPPSLIITKDRDASSTWFTYHSELGATKVIYLNLTNAAATSSNKWNDTAPTSSVFSVGSGGNNSNTGNSVIAYCFAPVDGYSSFGSYVGNGSSDGVFVYTGMRVRWLLIKRTNTTGNWALIDTARSDINVSNEQLYADLSDSEYTSDFLDNLSNGFKLRTTSSTVNGNGSTYIYAAFAESPFQYARAR